MEVSPLYSLPSGDRESQEMAEGPCCTWQVAYGGVVFLVEELQRLYWFARTVIQSSLFWELEVKDAESAVLVPAAC